MLRTAFAYLSLCIPLNICCLSLGAESPTPTNDIPSIKSKFYNAEEIHASTDLMAIRPFEPGYHKVIIELQNFPKNQEIIWEVKRLSGEDSNTFQPYLTFIIQDDGSYLTADQQTLKTLSMSSKGFLPGERATFRFRTPDNTLIRELAGIPNPAFYKDKNGVVALSAELVHLKPTVYVIDMPTMEEGEQYNIRTVIIGETSTVKKAKFTRNTPFHFSPSVKKGNKGGDSYFEVERKSGDVYFLKLPWGAAIENYTKEKRTHRPN